MRLLLYSARVKSNVVFGVVYKISHTVKRLLVHCLQRKLCTITEISRSEPMHLEKDTICIVSNVPNLEDHFVMRSEAVDKASKIFGDRAAFKTV